MSQFRARTGVVLVELKGSSMLVATREARKHCRYICRVNSTAASLWKMINDGLGYGEILERFLEKYEVDDYGLLKKDISACIGQLEDMGYLIRSAPGGSGSDEQSGIETEGTDRTEG